MSAELIIANAAAAPSTPAAGYTTMYVKTSDKKVYFKDDAGVEYSPTVQATTLVSTRVPFSDGTGRLTDVAGFVYGASTLTVPGLAVTNNAAIGGTLALGTSGMTVSGNANAWGVGVTPSTWYSTDKVVELGYVGAAVLGHSQTDTWMSSNYYLNSAGTDKFAGSGYAGLFQIKAGAYNWLTSSASGTAGNTATLNTLMSLSAAGQLQCTGTVSGSAVIISTNSHANPYGIYVYYPSTLNNTTNEFLYAYDGTALRCSIRSNGGLVNYSANNVNLSDGTLKTPLATVGRTEAQKYWDAHKAMQYGTYLYNDQTDSILNLGTTAQATEKVAPWLTDGAYFDEFEDVETQYLGEDFKPIKIRSRRKNPKKGIYETDHNYQTAIVVQELQWRVEELAQQIAKLQGVP